MGVSTLNVSKKWGSVHSRSIHGIFICIGYVSVMCRLCIGYVSEHHARKGESKKTTKTTWETIKNN